MKILLFTFLLFIGACTQAQDTTKAMSADTTARAPQQQRYYLTFTDPELGLLWDIIDNSRYDHTQIKEMQKFIRNQIALQGQQQQKPNDTTVSKPPAVKPKRGKP